jgi:hypothetical protein
MSARQQAGQLRSILARNLRKEGVRESAVDVLKRAGQISTGNLITAILSKKDEQLFSVSYKIDKGIDSIYDVSITYDFDRIGVPYYKRVDRVLGRERAQPNMKVSTGAIEKWINNKISNGTWKGPKTYSLTRTRGQAKETKEYSLSKLVYRRALAFAIARKINEDQVLETRSPYLTIARVKVIRAIQKAEKEFYDFWEDSLSSTIEQKIILGF